MTTKTAERRLNEPRPVQVTADGSGEPLAVVLGGRRLAVARVQERWRIDDEWWRDEISRLYLQPVLENGRSLTIFRDLVSGRWYRQSYG
jgi:hypothetical protein